MAYFDTHGWWNKSVIVHRHPGRRLEEVNTREAAELSLQAASGGRSIGVRDGNLRRVGPERAFVLVTKRMGERRSGDVGTTYLAGLDFMCHSSQYYCTPSC